MEAIIKEQFHKQCGGKSKFTSAHDYNASYHYFLTGWVAKEQWEQEQKDMDRDYQEDMNQNHELSTGRG